MVSIKRAFLKGESWRVFSPWDPFKDYVPPLLQHLTSRNANCRQGTYTEAEFLDEIQTKVLRFFHLATQRERRKTWKKTTRPFLWFKKSIQKPQKSGEISRLCTETSKKLYVHAFCFCTRSSCCFLLAERDIINLENLYTLAQGTNYKMHLTYLARQSAIKPLKLALGISLFPKGRKGSCCARGTTNNTPSFAISMA